MTGKSINPGEVSPRPGKRDFVAPLDFKSCVKVFGGDRKVVLELLQEFLGNSDRQSKVLSEALAAGDCEAVRKEAHSIKGGAAVLAAHPLMAAAALLEEAAKAGDLVKGVEGLRALEREIALLTTFCREMKKGVG